MLWLKERREASARRRSPRREPAAAAARSPQPEQEAGVQLNLPARVREGTRRWSIEVAAITTRTRHLRQLRRARHGLVAVDRAARAWKAGRRGSSPSTAIASPANSPSRSIPPCSSACWRWPGKAGTEPGSARSALVGLAGAVGVEQGRDQGRRADADRGAGDQVLGPRRWPWPLVRGSGSAADDRAPLASVSSAIMLTLSLPLSRDLSRCAAPGFESNKSGRRRRSAFG